MFTDDSSTKTKVEDLLLQLLDCIATEPPPDDLAAKNGDAQGVVLDVCFGDLRYTLTRLPSPHAQEQVSLSPREKEIVRLVAKGLPNKAISDVLEISPWTVGTYLKRIFMKLRVGSRAEMVAHVLRNGG